MKQRIYIDISVIGGYFDEEFKEATIALFQRLENSEIIFDGKLKDPVLNIQAVHTGTKVSEQYGNSASTEVQVKLTVTGRASDHACDCGWATVRGRRAKRRVYASEAPAASRHRRGVHRAARNRTAQAESAPYAFEIHWNQPR